MPRWVFRYVGNKTFDFSSQKKRNFCPKTTKFGPKLAFLPGLAGSFGALLVGWLVVVARGLYLARHLFTLYFIDCCNTFFGNHCHHHYNCCHNHNHCSHNPHLHHHDQRWLALGVIHRQKQKVGIFGDKQTRFVRICILYWSLSLSSSLSFWLVIGVIELNI